MFEALYFYMLKRGLRFAQVVVVTSLARNGEMTGSELAYNMGATQSTISQTLQGLKELGLVERGRALHDERKAFWGLTEEGEKVAEEVAAIADGRWTMYDVRCENSRAARGDRKEVVA